MATTFNFKKLTANDLPLLFKWFAQPYIAELWAEPKAWPEFEVKWLERLSIDFRFIAYLGNIPVGYIHYYHVNDDDRANFPDIVLPERVVGSDVFIGNPDYLNKGYGTQLIQQFIAFVKTAEPQCQAMIIDPASDNYRAIACYKKVGFKKLGTYVMSYGTINGPGPVDLMIYLFE